MTSRNVSPELDPISTVYWLCFKFLWLGQFPHIISFFLYMYEHIFQHYVTFLQNGASRTMTHLHSYICQTGIFHLILTSLTWPTSWYAMVGHDPPARTVKVGHSAWRAILKKSYVMLENMFILLMIRNHPVLYYLTLFSNFVAEHNLPFSLADHFTKLLPKLCKRLLRL
jgi:hypothetical protein